MKEISRTSHVAITAPNSYFFPIMFECLKYEFGKRERKRREAKEIVEKNYCGRHKFLFCCNRRIRNLNHSLKLLPFLDNHLYFGNNVD